MRRLRAHAADAISASGVALRRGGLEVVGILTVVGLIFAAAALGIRIPGHRLLPALPRTTASSYSSAALGSLASVSEDYVRTALGPTTYRRLAGPPSAEGVSIGPRESGQPEPAPPKAPAETRIEGEPGVVPRLTPGGWVLALDMVAEPSTVAPGEEFTYRMIIRNVGAEDFRGRSFVLQWHTPLGTAGHDPDSCAAPGSVCLISPGLGEASHEQRNSGTIMSIPAGDEWVQEWVIQTSPSAAEGTSYESHAHLQAGGQTITTDPVVVTVKG